jgi:hypothetical protein
VLLCLQSDGDEYVQEACFNTVTAEVLKDYKEAAWIQAWCGQDRFNI